MKKTHLIIPIILLLVTTSCKNQIPDDDIDREKIKTNLVEPGQVWLRIDSTNPFKKPSIDTMIILETKGDWVKLLWNDDTVSWERGVVTWRSNRVK